MKVTEGAISRISKLHERWLKDKEDHTNNNLKPETEMTNEIVFEI